MRLSIRQKSFCKLGGVCAILSGCLYFILTILAFIIPASIATYIASAEYFMDFEYIKYLFYLLKSIHTLSHIFMIGVVVCFYSICRDQNAGTVAILSVLAIIGYAVGILQNIEDISVIPKFAQQYQLGSENIKEIILTFGIANPSLFLISLGLPGLWFLGVSIIGFNNHQIPKVLTAIGILWGTGNILTAIAHAFIIVELIYVIALGALVFAPLWGILEGLFLIKLSKYSDNKL